MTIKDLLESDDDRLEGWLRRVLELVDAGRDFGDDSRYGREDFSNGLDVRLDLVNLGRIAKPRPGRT